MQQASVATPYDPEVTSFTFSDILCVRIISLGAPTPGTVAAIMACPTTAFVFWITEVGALSLQVHGTSGHPNNPVGRFISRGNKPLKLPNLKK